MVFQASTCSDFTLALVRLTKADGERCYHQDHHQLPSDVVLRPWTPPPLEEDNTQWRIPVRVTKRYHDSSKGQTRPFGKFAKVSYCR